MKEIHHSGGIFLKLIRFQNFVACSALAVLFTLGPAFLHWTYTKESNSRTRVGSYLHFILGTLADLESQSNIALEHFRHASRYDPSSSELLLKQAEQLVQLGKLDQAKKIFKTLEENEMDNPEFFVLKAKVFSQEMNIDQSAKELDRAAEIYFKNDNTNKAREVILTKVALYADYQKYKESIDSLKRYLKEAPEDSIVYYFLGKVHVLFLNRIEAKKAFKKALEIRPGFLFAAKALGLQLELEGQLKDSIKIYQEALAHNSGDIELIQKLINLSLVLENYDLALEYLNQHLGINPNDSQNQMRTALIYFKLKKLDEAEDIFLKLLENDVSLKDRVSYYLGSLYQEQTNFKASVSFYKQILPKSDYFVESRLEVARILSLNLEQPEDAISSLNEAVTMRPDKPELFLALAGHHESRDELKKAISILNDASLKFKDSEQILFMLGTFQDRSGQFDKGINTMKQVLEINPNNTHALNHIGYSYAEKNIHLDEAEELLKRATQNSPNNGYVIDSLGWVYFQKGQFKKASKLLEQANELTKDEPVLLEHLADVYQKLGRHKEALELYRKIMRLSGQTNVKELSEEDSAERKIVRERVREKLALLGTNEAN